MIVCIAEFTEAIMSIPPLLSSSPPPLEENGSICNDDFGEFSDYASVGAVSSATSINESSTVFRPIDSAELSSGLFLGDSDVKPNNLQAVDDWLPFDTAVVQPSSETTQTDSVDSVHDQTLLAHESLSGDECVGEEQAVCFARESSTSELPNVSLSTSPMIVSEQSNSEDISDGCCDYENSQSEELSAGKLDSDFCASMNAMSVDANSPCNVEEMRDDDESSSVDGNHDYESVSKNYNNFNVLSTVVISDRSEHAFDDFADDSQPASDENEFVDNFQSFSSDTEVHELTEAQLSMSDSEKITSHSVYSQSEGTASETDFTSSVVEDSATAAGHDEIDQLTREQILASNGEMDDDFDDFEEFVAATQEPAEHLPIADSTAYQWNAFESTAGDGDDWAAFQDSDAAHTAHSHSEVVTVNVSDSHQPPVTNSGRLSKVYNI